MKRCVLMIAVLLLLLSACGDNGNQVDEALESEKAALMERLNGMWVVNDGKQKDYYLIQDGKVYHANDEDFSNAVGRLLDDTLSSAGLATWKAMDFQSAMEKLDPMEPFYCLSDVRVDPQNERVIIDEGLYGEKQIIVLEDFVSFKDVAEGDSQHEMVKLAEEAVFSGEKFEKLFLSEKKAGTAPASRFWASHATYASKIREMHPEIDGWYLASDSDSSVIYTPEGTTTNTSGSFIMTEKMTYLSMGQSYGDGAPFVVMYTPDTSGTQIMVRDKRGVDLVWLLEYVAMALENFPDAPSAAQLNDLFSSTCSLSDRTYQMDRTVHSVRYQIYKSYDGWTTTIMVTAEGDIPLASLVEEPEPEPVTPPSEPTIPSVSEPTIPEPATLPSEPTLPAVSETTTSEPATLPSEPTLPAVSETTTSEPCDHDYSPATCTAPKTCKLCGETVGDPLEHSYMDATCTEPRTCSVCGGTEGGSLGHSYTAATCTKPKTCSVCGETDGSLGHSYTEATCTKPKTCSVCGETDGNSLGHSYTVATCTKPKTCSVCGETEGSSLGHSYLAATCTKPKTCSVCGETEGSSLGHSYLAATCTEPKTCSVCGGTEGGSLGHSYTAATCTKPKTCSVCGATSGDVAGHDWREATCTEPATCATCKKTSGEPNGHSLLYTKCWDCGASDFSCIAKTYTDISCYDAKTGDGYEVEDVSISASGVLAFTFRGVRYGLTLDQSGGDRWEVTFDCYRDGVLEPDATARAVTSSSGEIIFHLEWWYLDGCNLYFGLFP